MDLNYLITGQGGTKTIARSTRLRLFCTYKCYIDTALFSGRSELISKKENLPRKTRNQFAFERKINQMFSNQNKHF